jgi:parvulin-like peptidyl-prolyl isomerase
LPRFVVFTVFTVAVVATAALAQGEKVEPAATVNGQIIPRVALDRRLDAFEPDERAKARGEVLDALIDTALIDQYLASQKITVEQKEFDTRLAEIKKEIEKEGQTYEKVLEKLKMTDGEFREHVTNDLRWEKYATAQASDVNLKAMFEQHVDMFDGSMVRARHILITPGADAKAQEAAKAELAQIKKQVEAKAAEAAAKLPANIDAVTREQERQKKLEEFFGEVAKDKSACPSKKDGGDVNWFPRAGHMVEPFAKAAFALKPSEISEPIQTQFGWHLILNTGKKAGQTVKFEDVKDEVRDVYCSRLREAVSTHLRKNAQIVIPPAK